MIEAAAQQLVDNMRAGNHARLVAHFDVNDQDVSLTRVELFRSVPHQDGVDISTGEPLEGVYFEESGEDTAVSTPLIALLRARYAGKRASGVLMVNEENRVWGEHIVEEDLGPPDLTLKVEL